MTLRGIFLFVISAYLLDRGKLVQSRKWMDRLNTIEPKHSKYDVATDAFLLVLEGRSIEAAQRFRDCLSLSPVHFSENDDYLDLFCRFWLALLQNEASIDELKELVRKASHAEPSWWLRRKLKFPSLEAIVRTLSEDCSFSPNQFLVAPTRLNVSNAKVSFDF